VNRPSTPSQRVSDLREELRRRAERAGYHLNPDEEFTNELVDGLLRNRDRYGYLACPCRLASGDRAQDLDITCPCDYRDADLLEFGSCYCALYVSEAVVRGQRDVGSIPERRTPILEPQATPVRSTDSARSAPDVWRCRVCGYLCARAQPPERCPICGAGGDRFETFTDSIG